MRSYLFILIQLILLSLPSFTLSNLIPSEQIFFDDLLQQNPALVPNLQTGGSLDQPCTWFGVRCGLSGLNVDEITILLSINYLPSSIGNLQQIRSLTLSNTWSLVPEIAKLNQTLERLSIYNARLAESVLVYLLPLRNLRTFIFLDGGERIRNLPANFAESFPNLVELELPSTLTALPDLTPLQRLTRLTLRRYNGPFHQSICNLTALEHLDLANTGGIISLPRCVNRLVNLRYLSLADSGLGFVPDVFGLYNLEELHLTNIRAIGTIPTEIGQLRSLKYLHGNSMITSSGTLPDTIGNLLNLEELYLANNEIRGTIPSSIANLKKLRRFELLTNNLEGTIPNEIANCESMEVINLHSNMLSGTIPNSLGNLKYLMGLLLFSNILEGTIPASLAQCSNLSAIALSSNQLTGTLPPELSRLNLTHFVVGDNLLHGTIPPSYSQLRSVVEFHLSYNNLEGRLIDFTEMQQLRSITVEFNRLSGTIPDVFYNKTEMLYVFMQNNQFTGTIPRSLSLLPNTMDINLSRNRLHGTIYREFFQDQRFIRVNFANNLLEGPIPPIRSQVLNFINLANNQLNGTIGDFDACRQCATIDLSNNNFEGPLPNLNTIIGQLDLSRNRLTGGIPRYYFANTHLNRLALARNSLTGMVLMDGPTFLRHVDLSYNQLSGTIPRSLTERSQVLILSHNQFSGPFPANPFRATELMRIHYDNNRLSGQLPRDFLSHPSVEIMDISNNEFRGMLPSVAGASPSLRVLRISGNRLVGAVPAAFSLLTNLEILDLSNNMLAGPIPSQWGEFRQLRELHLSNNQFTDLPNSFRGLVSLEVLDISNNQFSGQMISPLIDMLTLHSVNMAHNRFTGEIHPDLFRLLLTLTDINLSHNLLTGSVPNTLFNLPRMRRIDLSYNSLSGTISNAVSNMRALEELTLSSNQLTGTIPTLNGLENLVRFNVDSNSLAGCLRLPRQFLATTDSSTDSSVQCSIEGNPICCSSEQYMCSTNGCKSDRVIHLGERPGTLGLFANRTAGIPFDKLIADSNAILRIPTAFSGSVYCVNITGAIQLANFYTETYAPTSISYTCGVFAPSTVFMESPCRITNQAVSRQGDTTTHTYDWACTPPEPLVSEQTVVIAVTVTIGGSILFVVIGIISVRYVRGKRKVEQLLNRVELLTLTTKNGSDDQFSLPQWHAPEDYSLKPVEDLPIQLTNTKFDFGTKGNLLQVDSMYKDTFTVQAKSKPSNSRGLIERLIEKTMHVQFHPVQSTKYQLTIDPIEIDVRGRDEVNVTLMLQMKMTTRTNISLWVEVPELKQFSLLEFVCASEPSPWIDIDDVNNISEPLGEGGFGAVYKAKYRGQQVAFKKLKYQEMDLPLLEEFNREVQMMMNLHHRCIVQFIGASKVPGKLAILTEFVSGGNLQELLNSRPLDTGLKLKIALDVAEALQFLHANNILHRDIKAENVLVASTAKEASVNVKLTDFGTARSIVEEVTMKFTKGIGTPTYMAPEILDNKRYERSADIYSFGILLWVIMTQQTPYIEVVNSWDIARMVLEGKRLPIPGSVSIVIKELIEKCWAQVPSDRPSIDQVVQQLNLILSTKM